ncbi:MAG: hypothetical protein ACOX9A_08690 [Anaerolineae bacterium]|jgi:hypothetical protein
MRLLAILLLACALTACGVAALGERGSGLAEETESQTPASVEGGYTVTLQIYSGRPDPTWTLDDAQIEELEALWRALPEGSPVSDPGSLGYRGFHVAEAGAEPYLYVYPHVVRVVTDDKDDRRADPGRTVERYLLDTGRDVLEEGLYEGLLRELDEDRAKR